MKWEEIDPSYRLARVDAGQDIGLAMVELCQHVKEHVLPLHEGIAWDFIRFDFWPDAGAIYILPYSTLPPYQIDKARCGIVFTDLRLQYERIADSDMDDGAFDVEYQKLEREWFDLFLVAARSVGLREYRIQFWDAEDDRPTFDVPSESSGQST